MDANELYRELTPSHWKDDEYGYCRRLVRYQGNASVGHDPKTVASYLRLQASDAFRAKEYQISARLGAAATAISYDARNNHAPDWKCAYDILCHWE